MFTFSTTMYTYSRGVRRGRGEKGGKEEKGKEEMEWKGIPVDNVDI